VVTKEAWPRHSIASKGGGGAWLGKGAVALGHEQRHIILLAGLYVLPRPKIRKPPWLAPMVSTRYTKSSLAVKES
jgi:hypothetical protein